MTTFTIPHDFLLGPGRPKILKAIVDFDRAGLPEYKDLYATVLDNVFTQDECDALVRAAVVRAAEAQSNNNGNNNGAWEPATISVGGDEQAVLTDSRHCDRIVWDDADLVERIWSRIESSVVQDIGSLKDMPKVTGKWPVVRRETWNLTRLNERMRFLRYAKGQYFRPHNDARVKTPDGKEVSYFTLHVYLNEPTTTTTNNNKNNLKGGATTFHSYDMERSFDIEPRVGRVLVFQQRDLLHSGADVGEGVKLSMRTDVLFEKKAEREMER